MRFSSMFSNFIDQLPLCQRWADVLPLKISATTITSAAMASIVHIDCPKLIKRRESMKKFKYQQTSGTTAEHCCVLLCQNSSKYNGVLSFFTFPVDEELRRKWVVAIRRDHFIITPHAQVCSRDHALLVCFNTWECQNTLQAQWGHSVVISTSEAASYPIHVWHPGLQSCTA